MIILSGHHSSCTYIYLYSITLLDLNRENVLFVGSLGACTETMVRQRRQAVAKTRMGKDDKDTSSKDEEDRKAVKKGPKGKKDASPKNPKADDGQETEENTVDLNKDEL